MNDPATARGGEDGIQSTLLPEMNRPPQRREVRLRKGHPWSAFARAALTGMLTGCGITDPPLPASAVRFNPPPAYTRWWALTTQCSGVSGALAAVTWYKAPVVRVRGEQVEGYYSRVGHRIVLSENAWLVGSAVRHEMLHALIRVGGHPRAQFLGACGGVVYCDSDCIAGGEPFAMPIGGVLPMTADSLELGIAVDPASPSATRDDGLFEVTVTARNPRAEPVIIKRSGSRTFTHDLRGPNGGPQNSALLFDSSQVVFGPFETKRHVFDFMMNVDDPIFRLPPGVYRITGGYGRHDITLPNVRLAP